MSTFSLSHLSDSVLLRDLAALVARDRSNTAALVTHIGEVDARKLYLAAAHPSMHDYCVHELHLSEDEALKRIQAARAGQKVPAVFAALAEGRLHLTAVVKLAPHLTPENADELLAAATHRSKRELDLLLVGRFPQPNCLAPIEPALGPETSSQVVPEPPELLPATPRTSDPPSPRVVGALESRSRAASLASETFVLRVGLGESTRRDLQYAQALLSHQVPYGDVAEVLGRALKALIRELEKSKFAATDKPRAGHPRTRPRSRHIPADVRRAVWERDQAQCTFVSEAGRRCPSRTRLEFDHVTEVARGGQASVAGIRLRCRLDTASTKPVVRRPTVSRMPTPRSRIASDRRSLTSAHGCGRRSQQERRGTWGWRCS